MTYYTTITSKGQITLPAKLRKKLKLEAGRKLSVSLRGDRQIVIDAPVDLDWLRNEIDSHLRKNDKASLSLDDRENANKKAALLRYKKGLDEA